MNRLFLLCISLMLAIAGFAATNQTALTVNGATLVPAKEVADWLGAKLDVNADTRMVTISTAKVNARMSLDNKLALLSGRTLTLETEPTTSDDVLFVPLSIFRKAFDVQLTWDDAQTKVVLSRPGVTSTLTYYVDLTGTELADDFQKAYRANDLDAVKRLVGQYPRLVEVRTRNRSALQFAIQRGWVEMAQYLISQGAPLTDTLWNGMSLLHYAAMTGNQPMVAMLIGNGMQLDSTTTFGYTPLFFACQSRNIPWIKWLLDQGANVNAVATPMANEQIDNERERGLWVIGASIQPIPMGVQWETPLLLAVTTGQTDIVQLLVEHGAKLNITATPEHLSPLHLAVLTGKRDMVEYLVRSGIDINITSASGLTALHCACAVRDVNTAAWLLANGAKSNAAARISTSLIDGDANVVQTAAGFGTPLMIAALQKDTAMEQVLQTQGKAAPLSPGARKSFEQSCATLRDYYTQKDCANALRQLLMLCNNFAQKHGQYLPSKDTFWNDLGVADVQLRCPATPDVPNGIGFNVALAGQRLRQMNQNQMYRTILFADCKSADHMIRSMNDIDQTRHGDGYMAVFADGHIAFVRSGDDVRL